METIPEEENYITRPRTVADEVRELRREVDVMHKGKETEEKKKFWKIPFKWQMKFNSAKKKGPETALVLFFNKKNEIEPPMFLPIYSGNMIVYKNKPYAFDPRAIWRMKTKGYPMVYCIKEIDRKPVMNKNGVTVYKDAAISNLDIEQVRMRGDSTENDEFLIKAALKAQTAQAANKTNWIIGAIVIAVILGGLIWFLSSAKF